MPDKIDRRETDHARFNQFSDEELRQILRSDASNTEGEGLEIEQVLYITEVLSKRRQERSEQIDTAKAWDSFVNHYYSEDKADSVPEYEPDVKKRGTGWKRGLVAAAAVLAIIVGSTATAAAFGFPIFDIVVQWGKETFRFGDSTSEEPSSYDTIQYGSLKEMLTQNNVTVPLAPTWFPEGYELVEARMEETAKKTHFFATYQRNEEIIKIVIKSQHNSNSDLIEQSTSQSDIYQYSGIDYYFFGNENQLCIAWIRDGYECHITSQLTIPEAKQMIKSIEKG